MPKEFLRDVLRTGDTAGRRQRHWSVLPLSIAGHAVVVAVLVVSPWTGSGDLPMIASPLQAHFIETVPPSPPPPPGPPAPVRVVDTSRAPIAAPPDIQPESDAPAREMVDGGVAGPGVESGPALLGPLGVSASVAPPPPPPPPSAPKPLPVGGSIREPRKLVHVAPIYPEFARQARAQGVVVIEAILDATGKVESLKVLSSQPLLDNAAVQAVRQWRYTPTELNGVPVPVLMTITVRFSLDR
jgi:periplasmic protein TonB